MNTSLLPSLERIAATKVAITIYNYPGFEIHLRKLEQENNLIEVFNYDATGKQWDSLKCKLFAILQNLQLPLVVQKTVVGLMRPIILEVNSWKDDHSDILDVDHLQGSLRWNPEGTINRLETAKALIGSEAINMFCRFILASFYFLKDEVHDLWNRMSDSDRAKLSDNSCYVSRHLIVRLWTNSLLRGSKMNWKRLARKCSTKLPDWDDKLLTMRNFFHHLTSKQRRQCLRFAARNGFLQPEDLRLCLPQLKEKQQEQVLKELPYHVLKCHLQWPLQNKFRDVANCLWKHLSTECFSKLLNFILRSKIALGWSDFDYFELFQTFWLQSPAEYKERVKTENSLFQSTMLVVNHQTNKPFPRQRLLDLLEPDFQ